MEKKTIIIEVETADGVKSLDRLTSKFDEIYGEVLPLTAAIGELEDQLYQMAQAGEQNTKAFKEVAAKAGELKKIIAQTDMTVDALSMTTANKLGGALGGVTAGFELVQGAMGAMGAESKQVEEALLKVQSAMAIAQGVQGIKDSIPAFKSMAMAIGQTAIGQKLLTAAQVAGAATMKVLNFVMKANPIFLIIGGITALVGAFAIFSKSTESAAEGNDRLNASLERMNANIDASNSKLIKAGENRLKLLQSQGATQEEIHKQTLKNLDNENAARKYSMKGELESIKHKQLALKNAREEEDWELAKTIQDEIKASQSKYKQLGIAANDYKVNQQVENNSYNKSIEDAQKTSNEKQLQENKAAGDKQKSLREQQRLEKERELQEQRDRDKAFTESVTLDKEKVFIDEKDLLWEQEQELGAVRKAARDKKLQDDKDSKAKELELEKQTQAAKIQMASDAIGVIGELATALAGKSEASQKRAFNINKAASMAQAVISTYQGASAAFASTAANPISIANPAAPFIAAGIATASGLAKVAMIAKTKFGGGASGASSESGGGGGAMGGGGASTPANFNIVGNSGTNQLIEGLSNQPMKAYVVGGEVTSQQSLDRNKMTTATI